MVSESFSYVDGADTPTISTDYAAASIYPVQIESACSEDELIERARSTFDPFYETTGVPVRKHRHYYLYEEPHAAPVPARMDAVHISKYDGDLPTRPGEEVEGGYVCMEYFVEMPEYIPLLHTAYRDLGGTVEERYVKAGEVDALPGRVVFNCSGYGSKELFDDDSMRAVKGHILQVPYHGDEPLPFSYTYTPSNYGHYAYMYPRKESILFGGSYLMGDIEDGEWRGESPEKPILIDGLSVPEGLFTVTRDIMSDHVGIQRADVDAKYGYRPYRSDGMRIEREGNVIHNYGHGGAGVSMSWWSALQAVQYIEDAPESVLQNVAEQLARSNV